MSVRGLDAIDRRPRAPGRKSRDVVFVEMFRLLVVVLGTVAGLQVGEHVHQSGLAPLVGVLLGAAMAYVLGGIVGRVVDQGMNGAVAKLRALPAAEVLAAAVVGTAGLLLGLVLGVPMLALVHSAVVLPAVGVLAWVLCFLGVRLGASKGRDVARAAGIARLLDPRLDHLVGETLVVDTAALMDRHLGVLGRAGLLGGGITVPRFVVDEVRFLAEGPDPLTSRRAGRALESLADLRRGGLAVAVAAAEAPEGASTAERVAAVAAKMGGRVVTCSSASMRAAEERGVAAIDLRSLAQDLVPEHPVGESFVVDLVRAGRMARQAVGYLDDGDMVVVNDAAHLVGVADVAVTVSGTRRTTQGQLVFAHLADTALAAASSSSTPPQQGAGRQSSTSRQ